MAKDVAAMDSTIFYSLDSARLGTAAIINNLHSEQVDMPAPGKNFKFDKTKDSDEKEKKRPQSLCPTFALEQGVTLSMSESQSTRLARTFQIGLLLQSLLCELN